MKQEYKIRKWKHIEKSAWNTNKDSFPLCQNKIGNTTEHNVPSVRCKRGSLLLTGWWVTSKSVYSRAQIYLQKCYTHAHFLSQVPYCRCWLITKPRLGKGHGPAANVCFTWVSWLTAEINLMDTWQHVYMIHTSRCCLGKLQSAIYQRESVWEGRH